MKESLKNVKKINEINESEIILNKGKIPKKIYEDNTKIIEGDIDIQLSDNNIKSNMKIK